jgi:tRNA-specific 2-thiouridylase
MPICIEQRIKIEIKVTFLLSTTQEQLDYLRFPLGKIDKSETRSIAEKLNLNVAQKPDSQDICFVPNGDYASVIKKFRPESFKPGKNS